MQTFDGNLTVSRLDDDFPPIYWPVCESHFKALVYLNPGPNKLRLDFSSPKLANSNSTNPIHSSYISISMMPMTNIPPLQLVILLGKDSPGTFDAVPSRIAIEGNNLGTAVRKFRMAAYLWQAFTAEQMVRNRLGRRCFRFEEEWQTGTTAHRDRELATMRSEAKIHIVKCDKTVAELRDLELAQQNPEARRAGDLFAIAGEAVKNYFKPLPSQKQYVSVLVLDSHWDAMTKMVTGHAAFGGEYEGIRLAIFGSHALQSYPTNIEEVVPAFTDCTRTDINMVANCRNDAGSSWEAANLGIGGHLHEVGRLFGCPRQESGIMRHDYVTFNRSFTTREPFSTRTNSKGGLVLSKDECAWHRLDCLRFRSHPCFRLPNDSPLKPDDTIAVWSVDDGKVIITANTGISFIEIFTEGDEICHNWIEYGDGNGNGALQRLVMFNEQDLRGRLPDDRRKGKIKLSIKSYGGGSRDVDDFVLLTSKVSSIKLSNGQTGFRGTKVGLSQTEGSRPQDVIFHSAISKTKLLTHVRVYHSFAVDGIEFVYEDTSSQLLGKSEGEASEFLLGEY
jgi:Putative peptidase family